ncbi:MAG: S41 family peptidase [Verrucomicrobia bacterium]|nr:S41 family peptidase [Cytophagales bacterium]
MFYKKSIAMQIKNSSFSIRQPLLLLIAVVAGILLGATIFSKSPQSFKATKSYQKFRQVLDLIANDYVDTVNTEELVDYSIEKMLEKLDPHTVYIRSAEVQAARSQLDGGFDGIGIEFNVFKDTVQVMNVLPNGPSETAGLQIGDKIVLVDGKPMFDNKKADNSSVFKKLKGAKGTQVTISILRKNMKNLLDFTIKRGRIPNYSIEADYMVDNKTGYIKVSSFGENTYEEFKKALKSLKDKGMTQLMLDLRGNGGGYLDRAVNMVDEMLDGNKMIVYTDGKGNRYDQKFFAERNGLFERGAIIVLIDEGSASASEITSGALQDNDRALVVGRRSFGKGLVQSPVTLEDGAEVRLTISRYYTPSGRSIQKPYSKEGKTEDYSRELQKRMEHGEFYSADSIHFDEKLKFKTTKGRTVYGGGGIMPDYFVPLDTTFSTKYYGELWSNNVIREFVFNYFSANRKALENMDFKTFAKNFVVNDNMMQQFIALGEKSGVTFNAKDYARSEKLLRTQIKALLAGSLYKHDSFGKRNEFYQVMNTNDEIFQKAMTLFDEAAKVEKGTFNK